MHSLSNGWKGIEPSKERAEYWMKRAIESKYPLAVVRKFRKQGTWRGDEKIIAVTTELADSGNTLAASALARRLAKQKKFDLAIKYALLSNSHGTGLFVMKSLFKEKYRMKHPSLEHANLYLKFAELGADYYKKYTGDQLSIGTLIDPPICGVLDPLKTVFFVLKQSDYFLLCAPRPV